MTESPGGSARVALASPEAPSQRTASATPQASPDGKPPFVCIQFTRNGTLSSSRPRLLSLLSTSAVSITVNCAYNWNIYPYNIQIIHAIHACLSQFV